jgi:dTDP-glucose 4,6-dehydratase
MRRSLVTGGAGSFIGSNFARRTLEDAYAGLEGAGSDQRRAHLPGNLENLRPWLPDSPRWRGSLRSRDIRDSGLP